MQRRTTIRILAGLALGAAGIGAIITHGGYDWAATAADAPAAARTPAAVPVETVTVERQPVRLWRSFSARLEAVDEVELRPQVEGAIVDIRFRDGQTVAKGDVLFVIDSRPFEAAVAQAKAELAGARDRHAFAERELARTRKLVSTNTVPARTLDQRENELANARAEAQAAAARLTQAQIDLDHAHVKAPIGGRVSRAEVTVGNLVKAGADSPVLTTIVSDSGIYADFDVDEATYLRFVPRQGDAAAERTIPVKLVVGAEGEQEVYEGHVHAFDNHIDPHSGTIRARAHFANAGGHLLPGMFATVEMGAATPHDAVLLSERAVLTDQDRKFVYVVDDASKAAYREVKLGAAVAGRRVITAGLEAGERVIVGGTMVVRPNVPVAPSDLAAKDKDPAQVATGG